MYKTRVTENIKAQAPQVAPVNTVVSNPISRELPNTSDVSEKQQYWYRILTGTMFWTLAIVAVSLFYKALSSLML